MGIVLEVGNFLEEGIVLEEGNFLEVEIVLEGEYLSEGTVVAYWGTVVIDFQIVFSPVVCSFY